MLLKRGIMVGLGLIMVGIALAFMLYSPTGEPPAIQQTQLENTNGQVPGQADRQSNEDADSSDDLDAELKAAEDDLNASSDTNLDLNGIE